MSPDMIKKETTMCSPMMKVCPVCGDETKTYVCKWCGADLKVEQELSDAEIFALTPAEELDMDVYPVG